MDLVFKWAEDSFYPGRATPVPPIDRPDETFSVNGLPMHIEAYRVEADATGMQVAWTDPEEGHPQFQDEVNALQTLCDSSLQTTTLPGLEGDWVIAVFPRAEGARTMEGRNILATSRYKRTNPS